MQPIFSSQTHHLNGSVQERPNSSALAKELWIQLSHEISWIEVQNFNFIVCRTKAIWYLQKNIKHNSMWVGAPVFIIFSSYFGILWQLCHGQAQNTIYLNLTKTAPGSWGQTSSISLVSLWALHHIFSANSPFILKYLCEDSAGQKGSPVQATQRLPEFECGSLWFLIAVCKTSCSLLMHPLFINHK